MFPILLPFSTNWWNVVKFLLFEIILSIFLAETYSSAVSGYVARLRAQQNNVKLKECGFGRLTPYALVWERSSQPGHPVDQSVRRRTRLLIIIVNLIILGMLLCTEYGSGSKNEYDKVWVNQAFKKGSAALPTAKNISLRNYSSLGIVKPGPGCVRASKSSSLEYTTRISPFRTDGSGCVEDAKQSEDFGLRVCAPHKTDIGATECSNEQFAAFTGLESSNNWLSIGRDTESDLALSITASKDITQEEVQLVGTDRQGGSYKLVEGHLQSGVRGHVSIIPDILWTGNNPLQCLISTFDTGDYVSVVTGNRNWLVRACAMYSEKKLFVFGVDHEDFSTQVNDTHIGVESFRISPYIYTFIEGDKIVRPHVGLVMAVAGQCNISAGMAKAPQTLRYDIIDAFTSFTLFRVLGLLEGVGEYGIQMSDRQPKDKATVGVLFFSPIVFLVVIAIVQGIIACVLRNEESVPTSLHDALMKWQWYETMSCDEKWLQQRLEEAKA